MALRGKLKREYITFREEITLFEYALLWIGRLMLVYALAKATKNGLSSVVLLQLKVDIAASFAIPLFHLLPHKIFLARISYRAQDIVIAMLLLTGFCGDYLGYYSTKEYYDLCLHVLGCFLIVFAGFEITKALKHDTKPIAPVIAAICGFGLSFFGAVSWEIFEFVCDQYFHGNTQDWGDIPTEQFLALFPTDPRHFPLLDTMTDLITGTVGSIIGGTVLFVYKCINQKKAKLILIKNKLQNEVREKIESASQQVG